MQKNKQQNLAGLAQLVDKQLPDLLHKLDTNEIEELYSWVSVVLEKERAGLDKLFSAMTHTFKYIPNFLLIAITNKYIEAPIAARITERLSLKQAVSIASGLPASYVGETSLYLEHKFSAELLAALPKKLAKNIVECLLEEHHIKVLDVLAFAGEPFLAVVKPLKAFDQIDSSTLSDSRKSVLSRLR